MRPQLHFGIALGLLSPKYWLDVAVAADQLGFRSLWMPDHLVFPTDMSGSPYPGEDHPPVPPNTHLFDAFAYLSFLAAHTQRIRLGTNVYLLGLRHPLVAARAIATLDILSQGRAAIGVGAGWLREEWRAAGLDPATRGARLDEAIAVCKQLWTRESIAHRGRFYQFDEVMFEPKPVQRLHPPLYIGGESEAALQRAAELGDGWLGLRHTPASVAAPIARLRRLCEEHNREFADLTILTQGECIDADEFAAWRGSGVDELIVSPWSRGRDAVDGLHRFAERFLSA